MREVSSGISVVPCCTGSSRFSCDGTTVFCTIQGPSSGIAKQEEPNRVILDVRWRDPILINGRMYDRYFSGIMERILLRYIVPELDAYKTVQINFNVVGEIRNTLFCATNAALLALVDGGIPLISMFYATSTFSHPEEVFVFDEGGNFIEHSFGDASELDLESAKDLLEYVKESLKYALKAKFSLDID